MATFSITHRMRLDDVVVIQTLTETDIAVGQSVTVSGLGNGMDGTFVVVAVPQFLYTGLKYQGDMTYNTDVIIPNQLAYIDSWRRRRPRLGRPVRHPHLVDQLHLDHISQRHRILGHRGRHGQRHRLHRHLCCSCQRLGVP